MSNPTTPIHRAPLSQQHRRVITTTSADAHRRPGKRHHRRRRGQGAVRHTILDAAKDNGIEIPTLCYEPKLPGFGACRMCVVEVEGEEHPPISCSRAVVNQMKINTHTRQVRLARKHVLELLLSQHFGECYSCVRNGNCELQSLAEEYGVTSYPFGHPEESQHEPDHSSYSVMRDMDKCIRCRRCVRTCIDVQEVGVLEAVGRSNQVAIETFEDMPLGSVVCINCGQCVNRCPVGPSTRRTRPTRCGRPSTTQTSTSSSRRPRRRGRQWARSSVSSRARRSRSR